MNKSSLQSLTFLQLTKYTVQIPKYTVLIPFPFLTNTHINPYVPYPADEQEQFTKFDLIAVDNFSFLFFKFNFQFYLLCDLRDINLKQFAKFDLLAVDKRGPLPANARTAQTVSDNCCNS